jgi:hypothetical protein
MAFQSGHVGLKAQPKSALVEGLIASVIERLRFDLAMPGHSR